ncbi:protodermal factor 1-like protein [Tanacetum coccineum]|uniref:Protodermal factor 1-like protein n=1 Tax=Tanacetum coccineum TaxID=301880 RepID=A0ABQ5GXD3_9ASTR
MGLGSIPGFQSTMGLQEALSNTRTDGIGALYREGTASLLNSMVNRNFPFTTSRVRDSFVAALSSNNAAAAQAEIFKLANEGRKSKDSVFTVNFYHDGIFIYNPLRYVEGDAKQITDVNFDGMTVNDLRNHSEKTVRKTENTAKELDGFGRLVAYCVHAVAGYMHLNRDPDVGVSEWYTQENWFSAYQFSIKPVCGTSMEKKIVSRSGRRMTCSNCLEVGHNKTTCHKDPIPKTPIPRKSPGRKSQTKSVAYASSRGRGRGSRGGGRGRRGAHAGRGRLGRGRVGQQPHQERMSLGMHWIMNTWKHLIIEEEENKMAREKEILERQDEEALQQAMEEEREYKRQGEERKRYYKEQRQWDLDNDYLNPKNFTMSEDEMDLAVAEGLVQDQMIDKVVVTEEGVSVSSNTRGRSKGKKVANEPAPALPFRIYHKNRGGSERVAKIQAKKFKIDYNGTGLSAHKAFSLCESE